MRTVLMRVFLPCPSAHHVNKRNICLVIAAVWLCSLFWAGAPLLGWGSYRGRTETRTFTIFRNWKWVEMEITEFDFFCSSRVWHVRNRLDTSAVLCSGQALRYQYFLLQLLCATVCYSFYTYIHTHLNTHTVCVMCVYGVCAVCVSVYSVCLFKEIL